MDCLQDKVVGVIGNVVVMLYDLFLEQGVFLCRLCQYCCQGYCYEDSYGSFIVGGEFKNDQCCGQWSVQYGIGDCIYVDYGEKVCFGSLVVQEVDYDQFEG